MWWRRQEREEEEEEDEQEEWGRVLKNTEGRRKLAGQLGCYEGL